MSLATEKAAAAPSGASRRGWPGAPPGGRRRPRPAAALPLLNLLMTVMLLYALLPLFWLVVNSTKTQKALFTTFGLWFGGPFALWSNIHQVFTYDNGIFLRWLGNTVLYVVVGAGGATVLATLAGYGLAKYDFPGKRLRVRRRARRGRGTRHGAGGADLPAVQRAGPDQHPVGGHHAVAGQPVRPLPDLGVRGRRGARPSCWRRPGSTARASSARSSSSPAGCWRPASSPWRCSPWSRPGTTTSCR